MCCLLFRRLRYPTLFFFLCLCSQIAASGAPVTTWHVQPVSSLLKLTARAAGELEPFKATPAQLRAARGEWECFQIVITAGDQPLQQVSLSPTGLATHLGRHISPDHIQLFWENYVYVDKPSGNERLEKLWWPDALIPIQLQPNQSIAPHQSRVLWAAMQVPADTVPGEYYGAVDVVADGVEKQLAVAVTVEPVTMPNPTLRGTVAVYYSVVREWYAKNLKPLDDAQFDQLKKAYYDFLLDYRINAYDLPVAWGSSEAEGYIRDPRVLSIRIPPLGASDFDTAIDQLKRNTALNKGYYYHIDEPPPQRYEEVKTTTQKLHAVDKGIKHLITLHPNRSLAGAVDIWCPNIGDFFGLGHLDLKMLEAERKKGRETWWYTMVEPKNPYPTWLLDDTAEAVRVYGRLMAEYGINGFVYSMAHGWGPKPLENLQSFAGTNGDGTLLYPSEIVGGTGPMPSIRLMLLRDAIEDYEQIRASQQKGKSTVTLPLYAAKNQKNTWQISGQFGDQSSETVPLVKTPIIDGWIHDAAWSKSSQYQGSFHRLQSDELNDQGTKLWVGRDSKHLLVAVRARLRESATNEWVAVDLAPTAANERWRFRVRTDGKSSVERHTREGQFAIEGLQWQGKIKMFKGFYDVEMKIPLEVIGSPAQARFNALRRVHDPALGIRYTVRAYPDANDVFLTPLIRLASQPKTKVKKP